MSTSKTTKTQPRRKLVEPDPLTSDVAGLGQAIKANTAAADERERELRRKVAEARAAAEALEAEERKLPRDRREDARPIADTLRANRRAALDARVHTYECDERGIDPLVAYIAWGDTVAIAEGAYRILSGQYQTASGGLSAEAMRPPGVDVPFAQYVQELAERRWRRLAGEEADRVNAEYHGIDDDAGSSK